MDYFMPSDIARMVLGKVLSKLGVFFGKMHKIAWIPRTQRWYRFIVNSRSRLHKSTSSSRMHMLLYDFYDYTCISWHIQCGFDLHTVSSWLSTSVLTHPSGHLPVPVTFVYFDISHNSIMSSKQSTGILCVAYCSCQIENIAVNVAKCKTGLISPCFFFHYTFNDQVIFKFHF